MRKGRNGGKCLFIPPSPLEIPIHFAAYAAKNKSSKTDYSDAIHTVLKKALKNFAFFWAISTMS